MLPRRFVMSRGAIYPACVFPLCVVCSSLVVGRHDAVGIMLTQRTRSQIPNSSCLHGAKLYHQSPSSMSGSLTTDEHEPLLHHHASPATPVQQQCDNSDDNRTTTQRLTIAIPCLILLWCLECGSSLIVVPLNGVLEDNICKNIYPGLNEHTTDPRCKDAAVQSRLTFILGWWMTFSLLPGLFTTVAWGAAADKYGRKPVLALANIGIVLNFASVALICTKSTPIRWPTWHVSANRECMTL